MPTPTRQRPEPVSSLAVNVEPLGPRYDNAFTNQPAALRQAAAVDAVLASGEYVFLPPVEEWRRRTINFPQSLIELAQAAQKISGAHPGGYDSLNDLIVGALENEVQRIQDTFNGGHPITPLVIEKGRRYRYGLPAGR